MRTAALALMLTTTVGAGTPPGDARCSDAEHAQLDFLVGNWIVRNPAGDVTGTASVFKEYGGCVLVERWGGIGAGGERLGVTGYRPERRMWHRDFAESAGVVLALDGRWDGTGMVMTGTDYSHPDRVRVHRVTWAPMADGSVEEQWRTSDDAGRTWQARPPRRFRRIAE